MRRIILVIILSLAVCAGVAPADVNSPWGINAHVPDTAVLNQVQAAGIGWVRIDMNWFALEPNRDQYNWGFMDNVVNAARARGLEIFATLAYSPAWANGTGNIADPPLDPADWSDFVYDTVTRYKGSIKHWGMWNEPNLEGFFTGEAWQYREWILKPGSQAARNADPSCLVLAPELAHLESSDWPGWLDEATKAGGVDFIDIITHHCYKGDTGWDVFDYLDEGAFHWAWDDPPFMDVLVDLGLGDMPVWLTEVGWHTTNYDDDISEQLQSDYYHQLLWGVYDRDYLEKVFPYEIKDDPTPGVPHWGILRSDGTPKAAYYTYQAFIANPTNPGGEPGCGISSTGAPDPSMLLLALAAVGGLILLRPKGR